MCEWLRIVRVTDVQAIRWILGALNDIEGPVSTRRAQTWVARMEVVGLVERANLGSPGGSIVWGTYEATGRSRPNIYGQTTRHEVAVSSVSARYINAGFAWRRDDRPEYAGSHQADGVALGRRTSELIEVELTAKRAPRYASIFSAYRRRLELGDSDRIAYLCTEGAARAAAPPSRLPQPSATSLLGSEFVFFSTNEAQSVRPARNVPCQRGRRSCSPARGRCAMGSVEAYETSRGRRYRVRYRDPAHQSREKAGFRRKSDAEEYLAGVTVQSARGEYIDPRAAKVTVSELGAEWLANRMHLKASSWKSLEVAWRVHVEPAWGARAIGDIRHSEVQAWIRRLAPPGQASRAATKVKRAHGVLAGILDTAVRDRRIASNPACGVMLPRKTAKSRVYLSVEQVELLVELVPDHAALVYTLVYTGMRWGEVTGLRVRNVDLQRRRARVEENAVKVSTQIVVGTPKTHETRSVPLPRFLLQGLAQQMAAKSQEPRVNRLRRWPDPSAEATRPQRLVHACRR